MPRTPREVARQVLEIEAAAVAGVVAQLDAGFDRAVSTPLPGDSHRLSIIVDHGSVEVFIDGGHTVLTQLCPPALLASPWALRVTGGPVQIHVHTRRLV